MRKVQTPAPIAALSFTGHVLLVGSGGHIRIVDGAHGMVRTLGFPGAVVAAALAPDKRTVAVAARRAGRVTTILIAVATRRVRATLNERGVEALAFSPDGRLLATGSTDKTTRLWRVPTGRLVHVLPQRGHVVAVRFSRRGRLLLSSSADGTAAVWDVRKGNRRPAPRRRDRRSGSTALSPDGTKIAVAFADSNARLYDASTAGCSRCSPVTRTRSRASASTHSGRTIVTARRRRHGSPLEHRRRRRARTGRPSRRAVTRALRRPDVIRTVAGGVARS